MGLIELAIFTIADLGFLSTDVFGDAGYVSAFLVLFLCGLGLPLPEEVTLLGSGILVHTGKVEFVPITVVCSMAILLGDSVPFWLGRRYGMNAVQIRWVAKVLHPERFAKLKLRFEEHGNWTTFASRFFAGVRIPSYFVAGTMGMKYPRFLILDGLGVIISVPISIYLGQIFADSIDELKAQMANAHLILAFVALSLILVLVLHRRHQKTQEALASKRATAESEDLLEDPPPGSSNRP